MIAAIRFTGQIGLGSIITLIVAILGFAGIWVQTMGNRQRIGNVHKEVTEINKAVNGVPEGQAPLVDNVKEILHAVNGQSPGDKSISKNIQDMHDQLTTTAAQDIFDKEKK